MNSKHLLLVFLIATNLFFGSLLAKVYYVDVNNTDVFTNGSYTSPKKSINDAIKLLSNKGGDVIIIRAGVYPEDISYVQSGSAQAMHKIIAEQPGEAILTGRFSLPDTAAYVIFEGLKWKSKYTKSIRGHHLQFKQCAFDGGPETDNTVNVGIGTNDRTPGAHHILIEDSWAYGQGGRYNFLIYNSDAVIFRRVIARHDGGWKGSGYDPEAGVTIYNSSRVQLQNTLVIDSDLKYQYWESAFYTVKNDSSDNPTNDIKIIGSIALNNPAGGAFGIDSGPVTNYQLINSSAWIAQGGISQNGYDNKINASFMTLGNFEGTGVAIWNGERAQLSISNSIIYNSKKKALQANAGKLTAPDNLCFPDNPHDKYDCDATTWNIDPFTLNLKSIITPIYSPKKNDSPQQQLGADIRFRVGKDGTFYGEELFDQTTEIALWPWPYEARIKTDLCESTKRGLCAEPNTLSEYIAKSLKR